MQQKHLELLGDGVLAHIAGALGLRSWPSKDQATLVAIEQYSRLDNLRSNHQLERVPWVPRRSNESQHAPPVPPG
jgi:hypothetical protein